MVGSCLWVVASVGFSVYLDNFASYNRVYGTLGALVAFLVWAWLVNLALAARRRGQPRRGATAAGNRGEVADAGEPVRSEEPASV